MEDMLRRLERHVAENDGDREAAIRLYRLRDRLGLIPPTISDADMRFIPTPVHQNLCEGYKFFYENECDCDGRGCDCQEVECPGCWACLAPSIYFGTIYGVRHWTRPCLWQYNRDNWCCDGTYCRRWRRFQGAIGTIRILRLMQRCARPTCDWCGTQSETLTTCDGCSKGHCPECHAPCEDCGKVLCLDCQIYSHLCI
jgi:hypothetical protein